jgi:hypothetical protein
MDASISTSNNPVVWGSSLPIFHSLFDLACILIFPHLIHSFFWSPLILEFIIFTITFRRQFNTLFLRNMRRLQPLQLQIQYRVNQSPSRSRWNMKHFHNTTVTHTLLPYSVDPWPREHRHCKARNSYASLKWSQCTSHWHPNSMSIPSLTKSHSFNFEHRTIHR